MSRKMIFFDWELLSRLIVTACLLTVISCSESMPFPQELSGTWRSHDPSYEDRYLQISEEQLILGTGEGLPNIFYIKDFRRKTAGDGVEWTFYCELNRGETFELTILYSPEPEAVLQFKNTPGVHWYQLEK